MSVYTTSPTPQLKAFSVHCVRALSAIPIDLAPTLDQWRSGTCGTGIGMTLDVRYWHSVWCYGMFSVLAKRIAARDAASVNFESALMHVRYWHSV
eukprot:1064560-Rhodomonas_salina.1